MHKIIVPKVIEEVDPQIPLVFLAGPIRGGGDWQKDMAKELIRQSKRIQIACPSRWGSEHELAAYFVRPFSQANNRQLHWERHYMKLASMSDLQIGCVLFWLGLENKDNPHPGPEPYSMDTRREIGKYTAYIELKDARVVVGGSNKFHGLNVIQDELNDAANRVFPFYQTIEATAAAALQTVTVL